MKTTKDRTVCKLLVHARHKLNNSEFYGADINSVIEDLTKAYEHLDCKN